MPSSIANILNQIGKYYGVIVQNSFTSMFLTGSSGASSSSETPDDTSPVGLVASSLMDITDGGRSTPDLIQYIDEILAGASDADKQAFRRAIRICYETNFPNTNSGVILNRENRPTFGELGPQGTGTTGASYSLRDVCKIPESSHVNRDTGPAVNTFSVMQVFGNSLSRANIDMGALSFFMKGIPAIEMSRAVPFIDIVLIQQGAHLTGDDNRISSLSMGQFLLGNTAVSNESEISYLSANDSEVMGESSSTIPEFEPSARAAPGESPAAPIPTSTSGMELFTTPQTLVPANELHQESDASDASVESTLRRGAPVMDRFRPLMSLKSVSFTVAPSGGMMSYKSGKISLTLHDKSRLSEVAAFVRPARYGTSHLQIEYGWAHPSAQPQRWGGDAGGSEGSNLIGQFIGNLRVKEKYQVVNSSFSLDDAGQVEIEMTISMLASRGVNQVHIGLGFESEPAYQNLSRVTEMINQIRRRLPESTVSSITGEGDILGSLSDPSTALGLSDDAIAEVRRLSTSINRSDSASPDLRDLGRRLNDMIGADSRGSPPGHIAAARTSIESVINRRVSNLMSTADPFFLASASSGINGAAQIPQIDNSNSSLYVSFGKIIASFVGSTIAQSGLYKDVQIIFYSFNEKASYMRNRNIASFPIKHEDFGEVLRHELEQLADMSIGSFMTFMSTYFLHDPGADAYGFNGLYEPRSEEDYAARQLNDRFSPGARAGSARTPATSPAAPADAADPGTSAAPADPADASAPTPAAAPVRARRGAPPPNLSEDSAALFDAQQRILRHAYNSASGEVEFKMPTIQTVVETVPIIRDSSGAMSSASETIMRIHVFDSQATSHATLQSFLEASSSTRIGTLNAASQALIAATGTPSSEGAAGGSSGDTSSDGISAALANFYNQLNAAQAEGLIEPWPPAGSSSSGPTSIIRPDGASRYRMRGGFSNLKQFIMRSMPSMRYGEGASGIMSAKITSMNDPALATVNMLRQARSPETPVGARSTGLPLQIAPVECSLETIGCPLWNFGQQVFIDFGTGTTADAIYGVTGVEHNIGPGDFKTSVKLTPMNSYARYQSLFDQVEGALSAIEGITGPADGSED